MKRSIIRGYFCLRPSAKDQGITWVLFAFLLLGLHLVHFLSKRNLREKNSPQLGFESGTSRSIVWHFTNWASETLLSEYLIIRVFKNHATDHGPVLVDTCYFKKSSRLLTNYKHKRVADHREQKGIVANLIYCELKLSYEIAWS